MLGGRFSDPEQERIELAGQEVCRKSARDAGERGGDAGDRVTSRCSEQNSGQGDENDIGGVRRQIAHHRHEGDDGGQEKFRRTAHP